MSLEEDDSQFDIHLEIWELGDHITQLKVQIEELRTLLRHVARETDSIGDSVSGIGETRSDLPYWLANRLYVLSAKCKSASDAVIESREKKQ